MERMFTPNTCPMCYALTTSNSTGCDCTFIDPVSGAAGGTDPEPPGHTRRLSICWYKTL